MSFGFALNKQYEPGNNDTVWVIAGGTKGYDSEDVAKRNARGCPHMTIKIEWEE